MQQFAAYRNRHPDKAKVYPYLLNVQSDLVDETGTRVMVPLFAPKRGRLPGPPTLMPVLDVNGEALVMMTPLLAGIDLAEAGNFAADLTSQRATILAALDILVSGI